MSEPWNLTPDQWSEVLSAEAVLERSVENLLNRRVPPWALTLLQLTEDSKEVLDLGSGRGEHSAWLALHEREPTLLDWSRENLKFSGNLFDKLSIAGKFVHADMTHPLPFETDSFDAVFSCGVFEYFTDQEIRSILNEAGRVARRRIIIMTPNAFSIAYRIGKWYMENTGKWHWGGERPLATLRPHFGGLGKAKITEFTVGGKHSLVFLTMPMGSFVKRLVSRVLKLKDHSKPSFLRQGYLLITVAEKVLDHQAI